MPRFIAVHPVIEVSDTVRALRWYCDELGLQPAFDDGGDPPSYVGLRRDGVEVHLQLHTEPGWADGPRVQYRFMVDDPDALHDELRRRGSALGERPVHDTEWGTREFGRYDPDGNALFFYRDL